MHVDCRKQRDYLGHKVTDHVTKLSLEHGQHPKVLAEPHGPEDVPHMGCDIPEELQSPALLSV